MPMGIVSDEELEEEISRNGSREIPPPIIKTPDSPGRKEGDINVPESLRKIIAQDAIENGRASAVSLAESFGISKSSVSAYTNGATSTASYNAPAPSLNNHIIKTKEKIAGKARRRLNLALDAITPEKLKEASLKTASAVAKDMAVVIKQMEPADASEMQKNTNVQVVLFAPRPMEESDFPVITVKD